MGNWQGLTRNQLNTQPEPQLSSTLATAAAAPFNPLHRPDYKQGSLLVEAC
jgi:hypothetical protein